MANVLSALGEGLQGLERGLLLRHDLKQQQLDRQIEAEDRKLMMQDRARQQLEFALQMKRWGLEVEQIEYERKFRLTPEEVLKEREAKLLREAEEHTANMKQAKKDLLYTDAQIRSLDALANYREQGGAAGMREEDPAKEYEDQIKLLDGQIRVLDDVIDNPESTPDEKAYAQRQKRALFNQRETLYNSVVAAKGFPISEFGVGEPEPAPPPPAPKPAGRDLLGEILLGGGKGNPTFLDQMAVVPGMTGLAKPFTQEAQQNVGVPQIHQRATIPGTGQGVALNNLPPDFIQRALTQGLIGETSQQRQAQPAQGEPIRPGINWLRLLFGG